MPAVGGGHFSKRKMKEMMEERGLEWKQISMKSTFQLKSCPGPDHFLLQQQHGHASRQQNKPFLILDQNRTTTFGLRVRRTAPSPLQYLTA